MKLNRYICYFLLLFCKITYATTPNTQLQLSIEQAIQHSNPDINIGIMVQSLNSGKIIYQKNANQLFMPASTLKIFPAAAALTLLGPNHYFQTKILTDNPSLQQGTLNGNIYFYFGGDPTLTQEDINELIARLLQLGIQNINGNIYIDDDMFDQESSGPGWMWDERNFCYAAPTSAITIDKNCFALQLAADKKHGQTQVNVNDNYKNFISVINQVHPKTSASGDCTLSLHATNNNEYHLTGCMSTNKPIGLPVAIRNVRLYAENLIRYNLQTQGIGVSGTIKFRSLPQNANLTTIAEHNSDSLADIIKTMLKKSDNIIADSLYKTIGYAFFHHTATWSNSASAIAAILTAKTKINFKRMRILDGSGLSRYNLVSPNQLVALLHYAYGNNNISMPFINALAIAGTDGTLKYRMPQLRGRIYAKTGNMANISSLTGYIRSSNKDNLAFAIIINSFMDNHQKYRLLQDKICTLLANS